MVYFQCLCFLSCSLHSSPPLSPPPPPLFLEHPGDGDPLWVLGHSLQGGFDRAVGLIQVVINDAEIKEVTICCLEFSRLVTRPLHLFILRPEKENRSLVFLLNSLEFKLSSLLSEHVLTLNLVSVSYRQCFSNNFCIYSRLVHCLEHLEVWRLEEHHVG